MWRIFASLDASTMRMRRRSMWMTSWFRKLAVFLGAALMVFATVQAETEQRPMVVAYLFPQDAQLMPDQVNGRALTRINYAFANIENGRMVMGFKHDAENFATLN